MKLPTQNSLDYAVARMRLGMSLGYFNSTVCSTRNHFSDNIYCREMHIPSGTYIIGKKHFTRHLNIILKGECYLWTMQEKIHGKQGMIWESIPGIQKVCYAVTDVSYLTIHYNPENDTSEEVLEGKYIQSEYQLDLFPELNKIPFGNDRRYLK